MKQEFSCLVEDYDYVIKLGVGPETFNSLIHEICSYIGAKTFIY